MDGNTIRISPLNGENKNGVCGQENLWKENLIKGYHVVMTGANKVLAGDADKTQEKEISSLRLLNCIAYNGMILAQEDTVYFQIV